ncbi:hypothetical protein [Clostridium sp. VAP52]|nr:hypothetical protein [Clostridium sp. VAP52]
MNNYSNLTKEKRLAIREKATKRAMRKFAERLLVQNQLRWCR